MKVFLSAAVVAIVLAIGTYFVLSGMQESSRMAYATDAVRLDSATN